MHRDNDRKGVVTLSHLSQLQIAFCPGPWVPPKSPITPYMQLRPFPMSRSLSNSTNYPDYSGPRSRCDRRETANTTTITRSNLVLTTFGFGLAPTQRSMRRGTKSSSFKSKNACPRISVTFVSLQAKFPHVPSRRRRRHPVHPL